MKKLIKIMNRSGNCPCDLCKENHILEVHHIRGRDIPDANNKNNTCNLCPNCHTLVHHGKVIIEQWFITTKGRELFWHDKNGKSFSGEDAKPYLIGS